MKNKDITTLLATTCDQLQDLVHIPSVYPPEMRPEAYEASRRVLAETLVRLREVIG